MIFGTCPFRSFHALHIMQRNKIDQKKIFRNTKNKRQTDFDCRERERERESRSLEFGMFIEHKAQGIEWWWW